LAQYDDGVGTSSNRLLAGLGGAFGWGLKRNVLDLYKFLCRNYKKGDRIYGFGFSRGAFTIRVLIGLIDCEGLVTFRSEEELRRNAAAAYRHYRSKRFRAWIPFVFAARRIRDLVLWVWNRMRGYETYGELAAAIERAGRKRIPIRFLGLWDTVGAYGMPVLELKRAIHWLLWPMMFGDLTLAPRVERACHALALDDERTTFHPVLWDEAAEAEMVRQKLVKPGRLTQVWFPGVHASVGGSYPEDQLALVSLEWMMRQAIDNGLRLNPEAVKEVALGKSPYARLYDSRTGLAAFYRYSPRQIRVDKSDNQKIYPIIHGSAILRMAFGSDRYTPISLRRLFWVLAPDGELLPMHGGRGQLKHSVTRSSLGRAQILDPTQIVADKKALQAALAKLERPTTDAVGLVWDTVWWRRLTYFATLGLAAALLLFPWIGESLSGSVGATVSGIPVVGAGLGASLQAQFEQMDANLKGVVSNAVDVLRGVLPAYLEAWTDAMKQYPAWFLALAAALAASLLLGGFLKMRINDRAMFAWHRNLKREYLAWLAKSERNKRNALAATALIALGLAAASWLFGWGALATIEFGLLAVLLLPTTVWRWRKHKQLLGGQAPPKALPSTFALSIARVLRTNIRLTRLYRGWSHYVIPFAFVVVLLYAGWAVSNRVAFDVANSAGGHCTGTLAAGSLEETTGAAVGRFDTDNLCWASGLVLEQGGRYRIKLRTDGDWFDRATRADVGGFGTEGLAHVVAAAMKRQWSEDWFKPVARIGAKGNDEYALEPTAPFVTHRYGFTPSAAKIERRCGDNGKLMKLCDAAANEFMDKAPTPEDRRTLVAEITARSTGELFLYVNDAVLQLSLGATNAFYRNNRGSAALTVERVLPN